WPSLRSMAGISNIAARGGVEERGRETEKVPGARCRSRLPVQEVAVEAQAVICTLLGVELGRKNIIAGHSTGKAHAVLGFPRAVDGVCGPCIEAVDEVEPGPIGYSLPD